jgi:hypothetical protein
MTARTVLAEVFEAAAGWQCPVQSAHLVFVGDSLGQLVVPALQCGAFRLELG